MKKRSLSLLLALVLQLDEVEYGFIFLHNV